MESFSITNMVVHTVIIILMIKTAVTDEKVDKNMVEALVANKVGKEEIADLLPDMKLYEQKTRTQIEEGIDDLWVKLEEKLMSWD